MLKDNTNITLFEIKSEKSNFINPTRFVLFLFKFGIVVWHSYYT